MQSLSPHHALTDENLATLFVEVEAMVNSRPLTPFTFVEGNDKPLSPNDMLIFKPSHTFVSSASPSDAYSTNRWRQIQHLANTFWERWLKEYLPTITLRSKWTTVKRNLSIGDIVLINDNFSPRSQWPLGRVVEAFPDRRGHVRSVILQTRGGRIKRPIAKLYLIEDDIPVWLSEEPKEKRTVPK